MAIYLKRRVFRLYLDLRARTDRLTTRAFACVARIATGVNISPESIRAGMYQRRGTSPAPHITEKKVSDETISIAEDLFEDSRTRVGTVSTKVGTLLTVTSIAVSGTLASLTLIGFSTSLFFYLSFFVTIFVFLCTGWFLFKFLGVGRNAAPNLDQEFLDLAPEKKKAAYVRSLMSAAQQNDLRNDFLVDIYKAGRRMCMLSFACALVLLTLAVLDRLGREDRLIIKLRADPQLVELLRGPKGPPGPAGAAGSNGPKGDAGQNGSHYLPSIGPHLFDDNPFAVPIRLELADLAGRAAPSSSKEKAIDGPR
jgi:hypothetical protein